MTNQTWLTLSALAVFFAAVIGAAGSFGIYYFREQVAREKDRAAAQVGRITPPAERVVLSSTKQVWPEIEIGNSGTIFRYGGPNGKPILALGDDTPIRITTEDGVVKLSIVIRDHTGKLVAELIKNEWKINPSNSWDRNYSKDAVEIKDGAGDIVFQAQALTDRLRIQAKLYASDGRGVAVGKAPDQSGAIMELTGSNRPKLLHRIEPMFNYPSALHLGEKL